MWQEGNVNVNLGQVPFSNHRSRKLEVEGHIMICIVQERNQIDIRVEISAEEVEVRLGWLE